MGAPIVHFEINGSDFNRTKEFYGNLFGWKIQDIASMMYGMVDTGVKMGINGGISQIDPGKTPFVTFYVQVEDPQACLDKAVGLGAHVLVPLTVIPDMVTFALFSDLDGCVVGLLKGPEKPQSRKPKVTKTAKKKSARSVRSNGKKKAKK